MSIQEMKSKIHHLVDEAEDETILAEVSRILAREYGTLDDLTDEQVAGLEKAREEVRAGKGISLAEHKQNIQKRWPYLKLV